MTFLLDTSIAVAALRDRPSRVRRHLATTLSSGVTVCVSTIAVHELWYGVARGADPDRYGNALRTFLVGLTTLDFDPDDAVAAGSLRAELAARGELIGPYDVLIAATARQRQLTLVTANTREFSRVPDLAIEDWTNTPGRPRR